jgi:hypothetical protein
VRGFLHMDGHRSSSRPKRIAFVVTGLGVGGAEAMLLKLLTRVNRDRFDPLVISLLGRGALAEQFEAAGVPVHALQPSTRGNTRRLLEVSKIPGLLVRWRPRLIQGWMYHGNVAALASSAMLLGSAPVLWNIRMNCDDLVQEKRTTQGLVRASAHLARFVARIVNNSRTSAQAHERRYGFRRATTR